MCGIFGHVGKDVNALDVPALLKSLRHRGPDGEGVKEFSKALLVHTRLSIIDLSEAGSQPMCNGDGNVWITFNGEIYNYPELKSELSGYPFKSSSDTEVILAAWERWGEKCLERLRGMFSFAIYDERDDSLFCAVDRFGIKPFYYHTNDRGVYFGSEVKSLGAAGIPLRPDDRTFHDYFVHGLLSHDERTFFSGISLLRPGHYLVYRDGRARVERYWDLQLSEPPVPSFDECLDLADNAIRESVRLHLRSDVGYGLSLSSGLDSNFLRCIVSHVAGLDEPLNCYSYCFPGTPYDECRGLRDDDASGVRYYRTPVTSDMLQQGMEDSVRVMEGPIGGTGIFAFWLNMRRARQEGTKVILSGQGTDELFQGYKYFYELKIRQLYEAGDMDAVRQEFEALNRAHGTRAGMDSPEFSRIIAQDDPGVPRASDGSFMNQGGFLTDDFAKAFSARKDAGQRRFPDLVKTQVYNDINSVKMPKLLMFQDKTAMDWGVEVRVPMLDHVLYETLFSIPTEYHLRNGETKSLLRELSKRYVDPIERNSWEHIKLYMPTPQREWLKFEICDWVREIIGSSVLHDRGYIDKHLLLRQFDDYAGRTALGNSFFIWKFLNLEFLYRQFFLGSH